MMTSPTNDAETAVQELKALDSWIAAQARSGIWLDKEDTIEGVRQHIYDRLRHHEIHHKQAPVAIQYAFIVLTDELEVRFYGPYPNLYARETAVREYVNRTIPGDLESESLYLIQILPNGSASIGGCWADYMEKR